MRQLSGMAKPSRIAALREDVGRHNAPRQARRRRDHGRSRSGQGFRRANQSRLGRDGAEDRDDGRRDPRRRFGSDCARAPRRRGGRHHARRHRASRRFRSFHASASYRACRKERRSCCSRRSNCMSFSSADTLVRMANQIAKFFRAQGEERTIAGVCGASHEVLGAAHEGQHLRASGCRWRRSRSVGPQGDPEAARGRRGEEEGRCGSPGSGSGPQDRLPSLYSRRKPRPQAARPPSAKRQIRATESRRPLDVLPFMQDDAIVSFD